MMKKIYLLSAIAFGLIAVSSCNNGLDEITSAKLGAIRFGVSTSYQNVPDTKTAYTGVDENGNPISTASAYERIEWLNTDKIRILSPQATVEGSSDKFADYSIAPTVANASTADITPVSGDGLQWGEGTHTFFAIYPSPEQNDEISVTMNNAGTEANIIYTIPEVQEVTLEPGTRNFKPDMDYAYMYAVETGTPGSPIQLNFKPLVTAIEFSLLTQANDPITSNLTSVRIFQRTGGKLRIAGTLRSGALKLSSTGEVTTNLTGRTVSPSSNSIQINFPGDGVQLSSNPEEAYTVTFLCLPVTDLSGLEIQLLFADGAHRRLMLEDTYETSTFVFPAFTKSYIRNVSAPLDDATIETPLSFQVHNHGITTVTVNDAYSNIQYRINKGEWADVTDYSFELNVGDEIQFRGNNASYYDPDPTTGKGRPFITSVHNNIFNGSLYVYGNIMSMIDPDNYPTLTELTEPDAFNSFFRGMKIQTHTRKRLFLPATTITPGCYYGLFQGVSVTSYSSIPLILPELPATVLADSCYAYMFDGCKYALTPPELPATTLAKSCYEGMFRNCTSLTTAPELPATTAAESCYARMFYGCTSLTTAPALPATTAAESCYARMFYGCTSLTTAPALPATTTAKSCYEYMFRGCTGLTSAPELPATTAAESCYKGMFFGCASLTTAPALPATTAAESCYESMFRACRSLTTAPELPATTIAESCYENMFRGCTSLTTAPDVLPATTAAKYCYSSMFSGCSSLTSAQDVLPATTLAEGCYAGMFDFCGSLETAPELPATTCATNCCYAMFRGCSSLEAAPALPATTVADSCYTYMFHNCTSLETAPELPATNSASRCYKEMFSGCTSLTTGPTSLPFESASIQCCYSMFDGCTSLTSAPELPATTLAERCYQEMFMKCSSLTTAPVLPAPAMKFRCYYKMFKDCTSLNYAKCLAERDFVDYWNEVLQRWEVGCISYMFENVSPTGTFVKKRGVNWHNIDPGTKYGWTVVEVDE